MTGHPAPGKGADLVVLGAGAIGAACASSPPAPD